MPFHPFRPSFLPDGKSGWLQSPSGWGSKLLLLHIVISSRNLSGGEESRKRGVRELGESEGRELNASLKARGGGGRKRIRNVMCERASEREGNKLSPEGRRNKHAPCISNFSPPLEIVSLDLNDIGRGPPRRRILLLASCLHTLTLIR